MLRETLESVFSCRVVQWDESDEEGNTTFSAVQDGRFVVADSLALFVAALGEATHVEVRAAA
jgi:hypothetical protein